MGYADCSLPPGFCKFGGMYSTCKPWLLENFPEYLDADDLAAVLAAEEAADEEGADAAAAVMKALNLGSDGANMGRKARKKAKKSKEKKPAKQKVVVRVTKRNKRKFICYIDGLDTFPDTVKSLKAAQKTLGKRYACSAAVKSKTDGSKGKEIVMNGDISMDIAEVLEELYDIPPSAVKITMAKK